MNKKRRTKWVIALAVVLSGIWLMGLMYVLTYNPDVYINPGIIVSAPSPVAEPVQPAESRRIVSQPSMHYQSVVSPVQHTYSQHPMPTYKGLYMTSSAQVNSVGGGSGHYAAAASSQGSSSRGISYSSVSVSVTMPTTTFVALASQREVSQPAAAEAPQMARMASAPRTTPGPPPPNPPGPLDPDHQLIEQPIGDAVWPLLLLALTYACVLIRKRSKA